MDGWTNVNEKKEIKKERRKERKKERRKRFFKNGKRKPMDHGQKLWEKDLEEEEAKEAEEEEEEEEEEKGRSGWTVK